MDIHVQRFIASLTLAPSDPKGPHAALVHAILLIGCYFSRSPGLADWEIRFLEQARRDMAASFSSADRLHDFNRASNLVAYYYFCKGKHARGEAPGSVATKH